MKQAIKDAIAEAVEARYKYVVYISIADTSTGCCATLTRRDNRADVHFESAQFEKHPRREWRRIINSQLGKQADAKSFPKRNGVK